MIVVQYALKLLQSVTWDLFVIERLNEGYGSRERDKVSFTVKMRAFLALNRSAFTSVFSLCFVAVLVIQYIHYLP